jgi:AcrR family transcriptional regulator
MLVSMTGAGDMNTRPYRMRKRLEDVEDTRRRIVEATVDLHGTVGPMHTTISGVATAAGVQRSTVYRHFPDEEALFGACTSHWFARHPWPRPDDWRVESDGAARLERGLGDLYRYYDENEQMMSNSFRDIEIMPAFVGESLRAQLENMQAVLLEPWVDTGSERLHVAIRHALDLRSWQSLAAGGLRPAQASELMAAMVAGLAA